MQSLSPLSLGFVGCGVNLRLAGDLRLINGSKSLSGDGQGWIHGGGRGEEAGVDDPEIAQGVGSAPWVEHAGRGVEAGDDGAALVTVHADIEGLAGDRVVADRPQ